MKAESSSSRRFFSMLLDNIQILKTIGGNNYDALYRRKSAPGNSMTYLLDHGESGSSSRGSFRRDPCSEEEERRGLKNGRQ